jgi:parallel beta-helix repeat protein
MKAFVPYPGAVIAQSVALVPGVYDFTGKEGLVIAADHIVIEGGGVVIRGGGHAGEATSESVQGHAAPAHSLYVGTGLRLTGRTGVSVRGLSLSGFNMGIHLENCCDIVLENCDVSDCFHDPGWGWDDHGEHGGILMVSSSGCTVSRCRANRVWDALHLRHSDNNLVEHNDFSHTSNTGLKMWHSSANQIISNNFSWGLRISPGEVHARDSACVLVESGSHDNVFKRNNMTHGGDGFFIRVLNGWMSTGNLMEENDCSYANNNGFEAWADHNTYIRNKANHCSYGFWLGNSNHTVLLENEAAFNGREFCNAPEDFGNAGIVFVNGSCSHSIIKGNHVHDNAGPGIVLRHSEQTPSLHVLIEGNRLENNQTKGNFTGHGIYLKHARMVYLRDNVFSGNDGADVHLDDSVDEIYRLGGKCLPGLPEPLRCSLEPGYLIAGQPVRFKVAAGLEDECTWDFGDGTSAVGHVVEHCYVQGGMFPLSVTCFSAQGLRLGGQVVHVLPEGFKPYPVERADNRSGDMVSQPGIYGLNAPHATWGRGTRRVLALHGSEAVTPPRGSWLVMQLQYQGDQEPDWEKRFLYPVVVLRGSAGNELVITPEAPLLPAEHAPYPEQRGSGRILCYPLAKAPGFTHAVQGRVIENGIEEIHIDCGPFAAAFSRLVINAVGFADNRERRQPAQNLVAGNISGMVPMAGQPSAPDAGVAVRLDKTRYDNACGVTFDTELVIDSAEVIPMARFGAGQEEDSMRAWSLEYLSNSQWLRVPGGKLTMRSNVLNCSFMPVHADGLRLASLDPLRFAGLAELTAWYSPAHRQVTIRGTRRMVDIDVIRVKLNREESVDGAPIPDLTAAMYALGEGGELEQLLSSVKVPAAQVVHGQPLDIMFSGLRLQEGAAYFLALGQAKLAPSREGGGFYRWVCGHIDGEKSLATLTDEAIKPMEYDWGTGWLVVSGEGAQTRLDHTASHVGVRLGLADVPQRCQVFRAPVRASLLTDGRMSGPAYIARDEALHIQSENIIKGLLVYLGEAVPDQLLVSCAADSKPIAFDRLQPGVNRLDLSALAEPGSAIWLTVQGCAALTEIVVF